MASFQVVAVPKGTTPESLPTGAADVFRFDVERAYAESVEIYGTDDIVLLFDYREPSKIGRVRREAFLATVENLGAGSAFCASISAALGKTAAEELGRPAFWIVHTLADLRVLAYAVEIGADVEVEDIPLPAEIASLFQGKTKDMLSRAYSESVQHFGTGDLVIEVDLSEADQVTCTSLTREAFLREGRFPDDSSIAARLSVSATETNGGYGRAYWLIWEKPSAGVYVFAVEVILAKRGQA